MNTKLRYLIIGLTLASLYLTAAVPAEINPDKAFMVAKRQLAKLGKQDAVIPAGTREIRQDEMLLAYIFDLDPRGYVVVGASSALPAVIAYSLESNFGSMVDGNPLFNLIKSDLSKRWALSNTPGNAISDQYEALWDDLLNYEKGVKRNPLFEQWPATGDGWLKTNWTQDPPYNNFCPMDPVTDVRSYAGCPATAMAQVMNFHETTNNTHFGDADDYYHNYAGRQYWIDDDCESIDFPGFPELNEYLDTLNAHYLAGTALTSDDKAALTFACGTAARQVYTSQGSGTFGVSQAYDAYIRFGCSTAALLTSSDTGLFTRLKQNIIDTMPAHLAVVDESWSTGHNVVVDGYNTDDYYHLNFGWGGAYNGWYLLPEEIPYELTVIEGVVLDIMKKIPTGIPEDSADGYSVTFSPNPLINRGLLTYTLKESGDVDVFVHDLSGRQVMEFRFGDQPAGKYTVPLSFEDLPGGIYFYTMHSGNSQASGKIIRVR